MPVTPGSGHSARILAAILLQGKPEMSWMKCRLLWIALLECGAVLLSGCGRERGSALPESQGTRPRLKLTLAPIPLENVEGIFAFRVTFENRDRSDFFLKLGDIRSGKCPHPDAIRLILISPRGKARQLSYIKSPGHADPAGGVKPYVVPLAAGSGYYIDMNLRQYAPVDSGESRLEFVPGTYRLRAEFDGTAPSSSDLEQSSFWKGKLRSPEIAFRIR